MNRWNAPERILVRAPLLGAGLVLFVSLAFPPGWVGGFLSGLAVLGIRFPRMRWLVGVALLGLLLRPAQERTEITGIFRVEENRVVARQFPDKEQSLRVELGQDLTSPGYVRTVVGRLAIQNGRGILRGDTLPAVPAPGVRANIRRWVASRLNVFPPNTRGVFVALLLGNRHELPSPTRQSLKQAGLYHILALSGLHVGFWVGMVWIMAMLLGLPFRARHGFLLLGLGVYLWIVGFRPSVLRAALMAGLWSLAHLLGRPLRLEQLWGAALFLSLLFTPHEATSPGFLLSFLATGGIFLALADLRDSPGWMQGLGVSLGASLATWPYLSWIFGGVNLLAPLWNALALPLVGLAYAEGMLAVVGGTPFAWVGHRIMEGILFSAERLPGFLNVRLGWGEMLGLYGLLFLVYVFQRRRSVRI